MNQSFNLKIKFMLFLIFCFSLFLIFFLGAYVGSKDKYSLNGNKSVVSVGNEYISIEGEMAALDYKPGLKPRIIKIICTKSENKKLCSWSEMAVMSDLAMLETELIMDYDFISWDDQGNLRIKKENSNFSRTIEISIENKSLLETYKFKNGEIRTAKLVGSFELLGSNN